MKLIVTFAVVALVAAAQAAPAELVPVQILRSEFEHKPDGGYNFIYETDDGSKRIEQGDIKAVTGEDNKPHDVVVMSGSYSWTDKEGHKHDLNYVADENGFRPESADIPTNA